MNEVRTETPPKLDPEIARQVHNSVRRSFLLLALMTLAVVVGPIVFGLVLRGGASQVWPPDRPIERLTLWLVGATGLGLMSTTIALSALERRRLARAIASARDASKSQTFIS